MIEKKKIPYHIKTILDNSCYCSVGMLRSSNFEITDFQKFKKKADDISVIWENFISIKDNLFAKYPNEINSRNSNFYDILNLRSAIINRLSKTMTILYEWCMRTDGYIRINNEKDKKLLLVCYPPIKVLPSILYALRQLILENEGLFVDDNTIFYDYETNHLLFEINDITKFKRKIGIYFGNFNPFHNAHASIVEYLLRDELDKVILVPLAQSFYKENDELLDLDKRIELIHLYRDLKRLNDRVCVVPWEKDKVSFYAAETLKENIEDIELNNYCLVFGSDYFCNLDSWKDFEWLLEKFCILVIPRSQDLFGIQMKIESIVEKYPKLKGIYLINKNLIPISAKEIRKKIKEHAPTITVKDYLLCNPIYNKIVENGYYH